MTETQFEWAMGLVGLLIVLSIGWVVWTLVYFALRGRPF